MPQDDWWEKHRRGPALEPFKTESRVPPHLKRGAGEENVQFFDIRQILIAHRRRMEEIEERLDKIEEYLNTIIQIMRPEISDHFAHRPGGFMRKPEDE